MALNITVRKNHLPACTSPFIVRSDCSDIVEFDRFVDIMATGRTALSKTEILGAMQLYKEELIKQLAEGKTVKTPTGNFFLCAGGSMEAADEAFLPKDQANNHEVRLHHRPERGFERAAVEGLVIVREEKPDLGSPKLSIVESLGEDAPGAMRAGGMIQLRGFRLRLDPKDPRQGVFFMAESGSAARSPFYPLILPASLMASVPADLPAGIYAVAVRAAVNGKDVRESRLEGIVVASA